jgi:nitrite reductase (NADH) small subunit
MMTYELGPLGQIPLGEGRTFRVGHHDVAIFRSRDGQLYATQAYCPHKHGPLADGVIGAGKVICPLHGYRFDLVTGCEVSGACQALATYPVSLTADGRMLMELERRAS